MCLNHGEFIQGQYYHVYNRAVKGQLLFRDRMDYENGIKLMMRYYSKADFAIAAYCLMPTHFHIVIFQKTDLPIYKFIYKWSHAYARYYNTRHQTMGTIFSDALQSVVLTDENHLLRVCGLIHLNPVQAKLVTEPELQNWEWSSYPEWIMNRNNTLFDSFVRDNHFTGQQSYMDYIHVLSPKSDDKKLLLDA